MFLSTLGLPGGVMQPSADSVIRTGGTVSVPQFLELWTQRTVSLVWSKTGELPRGHAKGEKGGLWVVVVVKKSQKVRL